eukprot:CAMPEP_0119507750 /NCGR_PEP_ID=MMETSP1344-20130328/27563_1 /TAXON_ID=236787 /ORGANISM="Florenciella parvula, Strain CCMP2471" /LENGTH=44 /DNA_ID= /DNA_START= /DNA_END= /DNA_ORIENTATION=
MRWPVEAETNGGITTSGVSEVEPTELNVEGEPNGQGRPTEAEGD